MLARHWFALAAVWTLAAAAIVLVQHPVLRQQADEPQVQLAEDAARRLAGGSDALAVVAPGEPVEMEASLAPWLAVYDANGAPLASSGRYRGGAPMLPSGVFDFARSHDDHRLSWQPRPGVRQALVLVPVRNAGFVVAGRSLRPVEERKRQVLQLMAVVWAMGLAGLLLPAFWLASGTAAERGMTPP
jgi:hypothetical protein